ncbi:MAG: ABC transporter [Pseudomonadota bacterium]
MSPDTHAASRSTRFSGFVQQLDPRVKIGLGLLFGLLTWKVGAGGVLAFFLFFGGVLWSLQGGRREHRSTVRRYVLFVVFWAVLKLAVDLLSGVPWAAAAAQAGLLGLRLAAVLFIGLALAFSSSPRSLGLALAWLLRPLLGNKAWQAALALALMIHFMPLVWNAYDAAKKVADYRLPHLPARRRITLALQTAVRSLGRKTWDQTLALAARGLDDPAAWQARFDFRPRDWAVGLVGAALGTAGLWT